MYFCTNFFEMEIPGLVIQIAQLMAILMMLVMLHELGHYWAAKIFGIRVERFFVFFDPWFSLYKKKIGDTIYGIGWLPLGGYVKLAGMIDESMDTKQMKQPAKPWEFRSKPAWQRLIVMIGGVTVNFILAIIIFMGMSMFYGVDTVVAKGKEFYVSETLKDVGYQKGDDLVGVNGKEYNNLMDIQKELMLNVDGTLEVKRDGKVISLPFDESSLQDRFDTRGIIFIPISDNEIDSVVAGSMAEKAGLKKGNRILSLEGEKIEVGNRFMEKMRSLPKDKKSVKIQYTEGDSIVEKMVQLDSLRQIGVYLGKDEVWEVNQEKYGIIAALEHGWKRTNGLIHDQIRSFKVLPKLKDGRKEMAGPVRMVTMMDKSWNWRMFWSFAGMFSAVLAFINLLPIPALDGGHVMFALYEMISGKEPPQRFLEIAQMIGVIILFGLMIFILGNDIFNIAQD